MLKRNRLILICSLISGAGVAVPAVTSAGIILYHQNNKSNSTTQSSDYDNDDGLLSTRVRGTKPAFLNSIKINDLTHKPITDIITTTDPKQSAAVKDYANEVSDLAKKTKLNVAANSIKQYIDQLLDNVILPNGRVAQFQYLENDINTFLLELFNQNSESFSLIGNPVNVISSVIPNLSQININAKFEFKNISDSPKILKDVNGDLIENLKPIMPGNSISFEFKTINMNANPGYSQVNAIVSQDSQDQKSYLNWNISKLQFKLGKDSDYNLPSYLQNLPEGYLKDYHPAIKVVDNFVFSKNKSSLNILLDNVASGMNPYAAQANLVGPGKMFDTRTLTGKKVGQDLNQLFENNYHLAQSIASLTSGIFGSIYQHHQAGNYTLAQVITDNAQKIANLITINDPSNNEPINGGPSINQFIVDLLSSYSIGNKPGKNAKPLFQIFYEDKNALIDFILKNVPGVGDLKSTFFSLFDGINSADDLYNRISGFSTIIQNFTGGNSQLAPLVDIFNKLIAQKDVYLLNLITDPQIANTIFDLVLNFAGVTLPATNADFTNDSKTTTATTLSDPKTKLADFLVKYKSLFINLLTSAKDPVGEFVSGLLDQKANNQTGINDILNLVDFNINDFAPQMKQLFDMVLINNDALKNTPDNINKIYELFNQISILFNQDNMNKITYSPITTNAFNHLQTKYSNGDFVVDFPKNETVGYTISVKDWSIQNSLISSLINLAPATKLQDLINLFLTKDIKDLVKKEARAGAQNQLGHAAWQLFNSQGAIDATVDTAVDNAFKNFQSPSIDAKTTVRDLVNELLFGYDNQINPNSSWLSINGKINVSYSGQNLYILPSYSVNGAGETITNYQIIGATLLIDPTDIAKNSTFAGYEKAKKLNVSSVPSNKETIKGNNLSAQLYKGVNNLIHNFIEYTAGRLYNIKSNIYLFPTKKDPSTNRTVPYFQLNPNDPKQNVAPNSFNSNLWIKTNESRLGSKNVDQTKDTLLNKEWKGYDSKTKYPNITDSQKSIIKDFYNYQNSELRSYEKYLTVSQNFYGTGPGNIDVNVNTRTKFIGIGFNLNIGIKINYEIRIMDSTIILPYKVLDLTDINQPELVQSIKTNLIYFSMGQPVPSVSFGGF